jgi:di/tricarboxylate transporter
MMDIFPLEVTAMGVTGILLLFNILTPEEAISGFSNKAVIIIGAIFIISRSLVKTGFLEVLADYMYQWGGKRKWPTIIIFLFTVSIISGFINNTAAVAIFIPLAINLCQRFHISPTKLLLPLSYAAIFGGTLTLIGTSTNLVVSSLMEESGLEPFSMFEFSKLGLIFLAVGTAYNIIIARWFLPSRAVVSSLTQKYHMGTYLTEFKVGSDSPLIGSTIRELAIIDKYNLQVFKIIRGEEQFRFSLKSLQIKEGDVFVVQVHVNELLKFRDDMNVLLLSDVKMSELELAGKNHVIVEGLIPLGSRLIGQSLQDINFRNQYRAFVLAIKRQQELLREKVAHVHLKFSDTLLIMVPRRDLSAMRDTKDMIILEELDIHLNYQKYWWLSILVIPTIMILATLGIVPIVKGVLLGVILLLILRSISIEEAYDSINWSVIFLIAALFPIGIAIHNTGADKHLGELIIRLGVSLGGIEGKNPSIFLAILYFTTFILSALISNAAVAVMITPIGFILADILGVDPRPFLVAICFAASASFMTPMGYQTNLMVFAPGKYRFKDFLVMGAPLTMIFWGIAIYYIPLFWPF